MKKIYNFLNNEKLIPSLAEEIVKIFEEEACDENIEYSFTISDGWKQRGDEEDPNTYFLFDTKAETNLHKFKKALFDEDLSKIEEGSVEEQKLMTDVRNYLLKVCNNITDNYHDVLQETVRRVILGNRVDEKKVPLKTVKVVSIDIADYSSVPESSKFLLKIGKVPDSSINTDEVIKFIQNRQEKTGMDIETVFSIEKKAGNPLFKNVLAIQRGRKFLNDISIFFFIDYSISKEILEKDLDKEE